MTPGVYAHGREKEGGGSASAFAIKSVKFPMAPVKSSGTQLRKFTQTRKKILICFRILGDFEKNDQSLFLTHKKANNLTYAGGRSGLKGGLCNRLCRSK